ncbi:hypothetical protein MAPG_03614 [Magnaporthiopsis poae ATCC 64411]|uniref:Aminoglycoside phosphotransferase domain-containing protein n=1 Tax=Magnaporthiopsis poae (strain ATCC 64411 / 73-15) TaxID=644358 RepID=A0A0C4DUH5_MAGP6|nr:hypothetical protein MAPG_03614 [Magnaporthiopsis poae ATCC 64411]
MSRTVPLNRNISSSRPSSPLPQSSRSSEAASVTPPVSVLVRPIAPRSHRSHAYAFRDPRAAAPSPDRDLCEPRLLGTAPTNRRRETRRRHPPASRARAPITPPSPPASPPMALAPPPPQDAWVYAVQTLVLDALELGEHLDVGVPQQLHWPSRPKRIYGVGLSNGRHLFLNISSSSMVRLLRCERWLVDSEAAVLRWTREAIESRSREVLPYSPPSAGLSDLTELLGLIPWLLAHCPLPNRPRNGVWPPTPLPRHDLPYTLVSQPVVPSVPAVHRQPAFSHQERDRIDFQAGRLARTLSRLTSPNGNFGTVVQVLPVFQARPLVPDMTPFQTHPTWATAFCSMLEQSLVDGQDMAIQLPYGTIRAEVERLMPALEKVTKPRLVLVNAASYSNILVPAMPEHYHEALGFMRPPEADGTAITGLVDWSNCIFGDPLFMQVFSERPSDSFLRGLNGNNEGDNLTAAATAIELPPDVDSDGGYYGYDDGDSEYARWARLLLYQCYHHVTSVVREFYRPQRDSTPREMAARRRLTETLVRMSEIDDFAPPRPNAALLPVRPMGFVEPEEEDDGYEQVRIKQEEEDW